MGGGDLTCPPCGKLGFRGAARPVRSSAMRLVVFVSGILPCSGSEIARKTDRGWVTRVALLVSFGEICRSGGRDRGDPRDSYVSMQD